MKVEETKKNPNEKYIWIAIALLAAAAVIFGIVKNGRVAAMLNPTTAAVSNDSARGDLDADARVDALSAEEPKSYGSVNSIGDYKNMTVAIAPETVITAEDADAYITDYILPQYLEDTNVSAMGDTVNIDFVGYKDGEAFDNGSMEGYDLRLGSGTFIDGFEDGLVGMKAGEETDLNLTFPDDYGVEEMAGQDVVFHVTVNSVKRPRKLDDALAKEIDENAESADAYRASIQLQLQDAEDANYRLEQEGAILEELLANSDLTVNEDAVQWAAVQNLKNTKNQAVSYFGNLTSYLSLTGMTYEELAQDCRTAGDTFIRQVLILDEIAKRENLKADDEDLQAYAEKQGSSLETLKAIAGEKAVQRDALRSKVLRLLIEQTTFNATE